MHENQQPVWCDPMRGHAHPRRTLPQQPTGAPVAIMPPGERESGCARATHSLAGQVPGSGLGTGPRPLPERLVWKNQISSATGYGPRGVDPISYCTADMYQSVARVQMGRAALKGYSDAAVAAYPTPSSGYAKQIMPLIRPQNKAVGPMGCDSYGAYGLGASSPAL